MKSTKKTVSFRLEESTIAAVKAIAEKHYRNVSAQAEFMLRQQIEQEPK